ncbi:hypothetical protein Tsubulata_021377 [Turnera subulata]|uniref:Pentacotripeptide-repeat region of PRORP domain-containing protein n=1 Tax=Turnera subulata TaxID=218843 RepID=A0A9Q0G1E2_9ROSI|nr:hypothetical protein Tsubulata_021377 [Turnera subulata]
MSTSPVSSICSPLSNNVQNIKEIDSVLEDYNQVLNSDMVLQVEFFSWAGMQMGFRFDDCVIEYVVDFLRRRKLFDDIKCLLITVLSHGGRVSCRAFSICIRFLGRQGRVGEALCLFEEMESRFKCKPDNTVYNNMLYVLCKKEESREFADLALSILRRIERPDTYSNILVGLCKFGRFETGFEVLREMGKNGLLAKAQGVVRSKTDVIRRSRTDVIRRSKTDVIRRSKTDVIRRSKTDVIHRSRTDGRHRFG